MSTAWSDATDPTGLRRQAELAGGCLTGKRRFESELEANGRLAQPLRALGGRGRVPTRAYECNVCGGWHLTSRKGKHHRGH